MTALTLNLAKAGDVAPKLALNLNKNERFKVRLAWDGDADLDLHALVAVNPGNGSTCKVSSFDDVLSTYNVQRVIRGVPQGHLPLADDKTFQVHGGALKHSPDAIDGHSDGDDEFVTIQPDMLRAPSFGVHEIPLIAMIHPQTPGRNFSQVKNAKIFIENGLGQILHEVSLSDQFGQFVGVQMGSILVEPTGATYHAAGTGFNSDFNEVLSHFS